MVIGRACRDGMHIQAAVILIDLRPEGIDQRGSCGGGDFLRIRRDVAVIRIHDRDMVELDPVTEPGEGSVILSQRVADDPIDFRAILQIIRKSALDQVIRVNLGSHSDQIALPVLASPERHNRDRDVIAFADHFVRVNAVMRNLLFIAALRLILDQIQALAAGPCAVLGISVRFIDHHRDGPFLPIQRPEPEPGLQRTVKLIEQRTELRHLEEVHVIEIPHQIGNPVQPCVIGCIIKHRVEIRAQPVLRAVLGEAHAVAQGIRHPLRDQPMQEIAGDPVVGRREVHHLLPGGVVEPAHELHDRDIALRFVFVRVQRDLIFRAGLVFVDRRFDEVQLLALLLRVYIILIRFQC